jgi:hypothetical protein
MGAVDHPVVLLLHRAWTRIGEPPRAGVDGGCSGPGGGVNPFWDINLLAQFVSLSRPCLISAVHQGDDEYPDGRKGGGYRPLSKSINPFP